MSLPLFMPKGFFSQFLPCRPSCLTVKLPLQTQTTLLQQQPNGLLIQPQALGGQGGSLPGAVHHQLSSQQIGTLQQQVSY